MSLPNFWLNYACRRHRKNGRQRTKYVSTILGALREKRACQRSKQTNQHEVQYHFVAQEQELWENSRVFMKGFTQRHVCLIFHFIAMYTGQI